MTPISAKPMDYPEAKLLCAIGRLAYERGFVAAWDGNLSVLVEPEIVLCTPTRTSKGFLRPEDLCLVDLAGHQLGGASKPTSEIRLHLAAYRSGKSLEDQDGLLRRSCIHLHPPHATAMAVRRLVPPSDLLAETALYLGKVALVPYHRTGTQEFADSLIPYLPESVAFILANHGALTIGGTLQEAWAYMEILEQACQVCLLSGLPGAPVPLAVEDLSDLADLRNNLRHQLRTEALKPQ
jgi:L-fuculose-phosphate aldolase